MNSNKYNRNLACKKHDNAYGINGGGGESERKEADDALLAYMRDQKDPMAYIAYFFTRLYGWAFFNYHAGKWLWEGQLVKKIFPRYRAD